MKEKKRIIQCAHCKGDPRMGDFIRPVIGTLHNTPLCDFHLKQAVVIDRQVLDVHSAYKYKDTVQMLKNSGIGTAI